MVTEITVKNTKYEFLPEKSFHGQILDWGSSNHVSPGPTSRRIKSKLYNVWESAVILISEISSLGFQAFLFYIRQEKLFMKTAGITIVYRQPWYCTSRQIKEFKVIGHFSSMNQ